MVVEVHGLAWCQHLQLEAKEWLEDTVSRVSCVPRSKGQGSGHVVAQGTTAAGCELLSLPPGGRVSSSPARHGEVTALGEAEIDGVGSAARGGARALCDPCDKCLGGLSPSTRVSTSTSALVVASGSCVVEHHFAALVVGESWSDAYIGRAVQARTELAAPSIWAHGGVVGEAVEDLAAQEALMEGRGCGGVESLPSRRGGRPSRRWVRLRSL